MNNLNLTVEDAQYIINVLWPRREGMINATRLQDVLNYANKISGKNLGVPGCSCEYRAYFGMGYDIISQNLTEIEKIANLTDIVVEQVVESNYDTTTNTLSETTVKRGRPKNQSNA